MIELNKGAWFFNFACPETLYKRRGAKRNLQKIMTNQTDLRKFLVKAKKSTYAAGDIAKKIVEADKLMAVVVEA